MKIYYWAKHNAIYLEINGRRNLIRITDGKLNHWLSQEFLCELEEIGEL